MWEKFSRPYMVAGFLIWRTSLLSRISEQMSCEELAIFFSILAYMAHISLLALKGQDFKLRCLQFHFIRTCHFEASEDIMTKLKSQALHTTKIKYGKVNGSGNPNSLNHVLWNIGILLHKQATSAKHFGSECIFWKITHSKYIEQKF